MHKRSVSLWALALLVALIAACGEDAKDTTNGPVADPSESEAPLSDLDALLDGAPDSSKLPEEAKADATFPNKFTDLVELQSPVKSQGSRGVCSIFSTVALMEHLYIKEGTLQNPDFSEQFLQWSAKVEVGRFPHTSGSNASANLDAISRFGVVDEVDSPYEPKPWSSFDDERCTGDDQPTVCYTNGNPSEEVLASKRWFLPGSRYVSSSIRSIKSVMHQRRTAVVAGMTFFYQSWNHRRSQLPVNSQYWSEGYVLSPNAEDRRISLEKRAGHSILLVGWDDDLEVPRVDEEGKVITDANGDPVMEKGFFLFKNSWGTDGFGLRNEAGPGYGWVSYDYIKEFASVVTAREPRLDLTPEICDDGIDNNLDRQLDCDDPQCFGTPACGGSVDDDNTGDTTLGNTEVVDIPDNDPNGVSTTDLFEEEGFIESATLNLDITHPFIGDLEVLLISADGRTFVIHDNTGASADDIFRSFEVPELVGAPAKGTWSVQVVDSGASDAGTLNAWSLDLVLTDTALAEVCDDGIDNVGNGLSDCADPSCANNPVCQDAGTTSGASSINANIPDNDPAGLVDTIALTAEGTVKQVEISVDITHTFRGDLTVSVIAPDGTEAILADKEGGSANDIVESYIVEDFNGSEISGAWTLKVSDHANSDTGVLNSWGIVATPAE